MSNDTEVLSVFRGSGNPYVDLNLPDAEAMLVKAEVVARLEEAIASRRLNVSGAARMLGLAAAELDAILTGYFDSVEIIQLQKFLSLLEEKPHA